MEMKRDSLYFALGSVALLIVIGVVGFFVRTGGSNVFFATSLAAIPTGLIIVAVTFLLRKSGHKVQLIWCCFSMILLRSVQLWEVGIDFRDELRFIGYSRTLFEQGQFLGYLRYYPVNIPFAGIFYGLYSVFRDVETFEVLSVVVYPLLVVGYYYMVNEIAKLKHYAGSLSPLIPAVMFLPFAPTFSIIPTYYWPQMLGLGVLFFALGSLLSFLNSDAQSRKKMLLVVSGLSVVLVFTHSISSALYLLTIPFFYWATQDEGKKRITVLLWIGTFVLFIAAHYEQYWSTWVELYRALLGDASAWERLARFSFPNLGSISRQGIFMTLGHTGFFIVVGILVLIRVFKSYSLGSDVSMSVKERIIKLPRSLLQILRTDPLSSSFVGLGILAIASAVVLDGNFLDPVRVIGWSSLLALPVVIPKKKGYALVLVVVLLALFFLLVWTVNSPWGSPLGSSQNLNNR